MKKIFAVLTFAPALAFATPVMLKINNWELFAQATDGSSIQKGQLVQNKDLDSNLVACETLTMDASVDVAQYVGDLTFSATNTQSQSQFNADFKYEAATGEAIYVHCSEATKSVTIDDVNSTLGSIAQMIPPSTSKR